MDEGPAPPSVLPIPTYACAGPVNRPGLQTSFSTGSFLVSLIRQRGSFWFLTTEASSSILERGTKVKICDIVSTSAVRFGVRPWLGWVRARSGTPGGETLYEKISGTRRT